MTPLIRLAQKIVNASSTDRRIVGDFIITAGNDSAEIRFSYDPDLLEDFKMTFPRARWQSTSRSWNVPGRTAAKRLAKWREKVVDAIIEQREQRRIEEQRARDAILAFDPLPKSPYVRASSDGIIVTVRYHPELSSLLRKLPHGRWDPSLLRWTFPFTSGEAIRSELKEIERLARAAEEMAEQETRSRIAAIDAKLRAAIEAKAAIEREYVSRHPRPLRTEYLVPKSKRLHFFEIEAIGDDTTPIMEMFGMWRRAWVAQIMGVDGRGKWARSFLTGSKDYNRANSVGSRGVYVSFHLMEGPIYEVSEPISWKKTDSYFLRIEGGSRRRMALEEVSECLEVNK